MTRAELLLVAMDLSEGLELLPWLADRLCLAFGVGVRIAEAPLDIRACLSKERSQYDTRALLTALLRQPGPEYIMGVTSVDLFLPVFTFVIGEACLGGRASVVSTYRLLDERYGLPPDPQRFQERLLKEAVHELGHCHGLVHCLEPRCAMHKSSVAEDVDLKTEELCSRCERKLAARGVGAR